MSALHGLHTCGICGAVVGDELLHREWHAVVTDLHDTAYETAEVADRVSYLLDRSATA
jgi:hypothetical protein